MSWELAYLCDNVRHCIRENEYDRCHEIISDAMREFPHAPEPHNLIGILLEKEGDHITAMKHFRAAWALDPAYVPARHNLNRFASLQTQGDYAFDESDIKEQLS